MALPDTPLRIRSARSAGAIGRPVWWALFCSLLLTACGGAGETDARAPDEAAGDLVTELGEDASEPVRRFVLWQSGAEAAVRAEQGVLAGDAGANDVRLVVRINPAAVHPDGRAALAGSASGNGEGGSASAHRALVLGAKVAAVATASEGVMSASVRRWAPTAVVRQHFAHALEGFVLSVPWSQAQSVADQLARNPEVDAVELDRVLTVEQVAATREVDARAWGVDRIDQRVRALDGRFGNRHSGQGVSIHVVDTGISPHDQFGTRLLGGYSAVQDGRGTTDCHGHGTHVAGTAAGRTMGVAPDAVVVPVRVMDCRGSGSSTQVLAGLDWIAAHGARPGVVNMSLGGPASSAIDAAAQRLVASGFTVVAAAGNSNADACTQSPARAAGIVSVAASDAADAKASFSNAGACVALWAPGTSIASAGIASSSAVVALSGTSMAAPHAAGAAALLLQAQPAATAAQVRGRLLQDATPNLVMGLTGSTTRSLLFAGDGDAAAPLPVSTLVHPSAISMSTAVPAVGQWTATASVQVVTATGKAAAGVLVTGRFSHMPSSLSCTTAQNGRCSLTGAVALWGSTTKIGFAVTGLSGPLVADAGRGVRQAQQAQPAAPVAAVSDISGSIVRPSAASAQWVPQFVVRLGDAQRNPVAGATVQGQLTIHSGARVVGVQAVACQTAADGRCRLAWTGPALGSAQTGAVLQVKAVSRAFLVYRPGALTQAAVGVVR